MPRRRPLKHREKTRARADVFSVLENSFVRSAQKQVHQYFASQLPLLPVAFTAPHSGQLLSARCPWGIGPRTRCGYQTPLCSGLSYKRRRTVGPRYLRVSIRRWEVPPFPLRALRVASVSARRSARKAHT